MMQMDHRELAKRIESRIDRLEIKIDKYLEQAAENHADLQWVRGYIKMSVLGMIALAGSVITVFIKLFLK